MTYRYGELNERVISQGGGYTWLIVTCLAFDLDMLPLEYNALDSYPWIIIRFPRRGEVARVSDQGLGVLLREVVPNSLPHSNIEADSVMMAIKIGE